MLIEIAVDHNKNAEFVEWLNEMGHDARIGKSTGNYIDGELTSNNEDANQILRNLWEEYCKFN